MQLQYVLATYDYIFCFETVSGCIRPLSKYLVTVAGHVTACRHHITFRPLKYVPVLVVLAIGRRGPQATTEHGYICIFELFFCHSHVHDCIIYLYETVWSLQYQLLRAALH
jgi:hypothetical protein